MSLNIPIHCVDAFVDDAAFSGNPAAVCPLERWLPDALMQAMAAQHNLSETAFVVANDAGGFDLRWFTPSVEVDLCGHATLAAAHTLFEQSGFDGDEVAFETRSGRLTVARTGTDLVMDLPSYVLDRRPVAPAVRAATGGEPLEELTQLDWGEGGWAVLVYATQTEIEALKPDMGALKAAGVEVLVTAPGENGVDFVSRFFAPTVGIDEDPVTGSAHCALAPYWAEKLGKTKMSARQLSERGGRLSVASRGERTALTGRCRTYSSGVITLDEGALRA